jgi:DNA-binding transcriptional LysR family regulator
VISALGLRYFSEVTRCGSFRAAAEHICVAPSAISRQIALLEEELGAPLLERGRGRTALRLTSAGEILMQYVRSTDNEMQRVRSDIEALKGLRKGQLRFGIPETFTRDFMPEFLVRFNRLYPRITYHVHVAGSPRLLEMVAADELDAALSFNPPPMTDITHLYERMLPTSVLVSDDHPLANREFVRLSDCAEYGMALPDNSISAKRMHDEMFARAKIRPRPVLVSNSYELMRSASAAGLCLALVNEHMTYDGVRKVGYRYVPVRDARVKPQRFTLCVRTGRNLPVAATTFVEHLRREFDRLHNPLATTP